MSPVFTMLFAFAVPLVAAPLVVLARRRPNLRESVTLAAATTLLGLVVILAPQVMDGARPTVILAEPFPGLPLALTLEPLGMLFALIASFLWLITSVYSIGYMRGHKEQHQTRF